MTVHFFTVGQPGKIPRNFTEIDCLGKDYYTSSPPPPLSPKKFLGLRSGYDKGIIYNRFFFKRSTRYRYDGSIRNHHFNVVLDTRRELKRPKIECASIYDKFASKLSTFWTPLSFLIILELMKFSKDAEIIRLIVSFEQIFASETFCAPDHNGS